MANLRITRLGHRSIVYRSPRDVWIWVDRWPGATVGLNGVNQTAVSPMPSSAFPS